MTITGELFQDGTCFTVHDAHSTTPSARSHPWWRTAYKVSDAIHPDEPTEILRWVHEEMQHRERLFWSGRTVRTTSGKCLNAAAARPRSRPLTLSAHGRRPAPRSRGAGLRPFRVPPPVSRRNPS